ncbi:hypothetical protein H7H78_11755 [Mycobacterium shinjukuense]|uniref:Membrane protein n=1 Tax=Mycobacterium shinjukuense TaxID=398694 RepID=A0A7I7MKC3_9MYCO|nr:gephyrin-like molybdotransferase receptor GlpR [Mycobacterium shinjukuense]MCV6986081.1 hypothetical protein [Mycobacterium shinjukuense]ORB70073.1 hypothetical protein BST45_07260 [Mycobacterium shinjukuense]BBX72270.1 membrane protein [Mycobacterium shinjukuense]
MPSVPQSLLWISLVVLWLFVLVPMLISKRDAVRRTSDVALATRVLNGDAGARLLRRGPAAGHRGDPDWRPEQDGGPEAVDGELADAEGDPDQRADLVVRPRPVLMKDSRDAAADEPDYLDAEVVDETAGALPLGASAAAGESAGPAEVDEEVTDQDDPAGAERGRADDEYEYVEDSCGLEPDEPEENESEQDADAPAMFSPGGSRRRRFDTKTAAAVSARKYAFRKRVLLMMAVILVGSAVAAFEVTRVAWWICGSATVITVLYLGYLRRQTRIEEKVRRRRMQRLARARLGVENAHDREYDLVPSRLRRPGAVVLEIDDEDPIFEHLDHPVAQRTYGWPRDLPRAVGQ